MNEESNGMEVYTGFKKIAAKPMTRGEYNALRGWHVPPDEDPNDRGYLVEYLDSPNANHPNFKNYISWSPQDVFEKAYRKLSDGAIFEMSVSFSENDEVEQLKLAYAYLYDRFTDFERYLLVGPQYAKEKLIDLKMSHVDLFFKAKKVRENSKDVPDWIKAHPLNPSEAFDSK
jgi:hypothetical protein